MSSQNTFGDELKVAGRQIGHTAKEAFHAGNVRRLVIRSKSGSTIVSLTLTVAVVLALLVPWLAALSVVALIATESSANIETEAEPPA